MMPATARAAIARERLSFYRQLNRFYFSGFVRMFGLAMPLVLLAVPGIWRILGVLYLVVWVLLVSASTGAMCALLFDALLIIRNRQPIILPQLLFARDVARHRVETRRAIKQFHQFAALAYWANPLANVTVAIMLLAIRMRPAIIQRVVSMLTDWQEEEKRIVIGGEPTIEYMSPAIDHAVAPAVGPPKGRQQEIQFA